MNVFILDKDIATSAKFLDDAHLRAQINESCQILMANYNHTKYPETKIGHINHPVTKFYSKEDEMEELYSYLSYLLDEYLYRFNKEHQNYFWLEGFTKDIYYINRETFKFSKTYVNDHMTDNIEEIRNYIMTKPHERKLTWTNRNKPDWWII